MRNLAARFIRQSTNRITKAADISIPTEPVHVVDPSLDMRHLFENVTILKNNLKARNITTFGPIEKLKKDYFDWWEAYKSFCNCSDDNDEKRQLRSKLLDKSPALQAILTLPNNLDDQQNCSKQQEVEQSIPKAIHEELEQISREIKGKISDPVLLERALRSALLNVARLFLKPVPLSNSLFVRPALVECCNIDQNQYPMVTDGTDSPMFLAGVDLPHFLPLLVKQCFNTGQNNKWPICLMANGPSYHIRHNQFHQSEKIAFLILARSQTECSDALARVRALLHIFVCQFVNKAAISLEDLRPAELKLWESSATKLQWKPEGFELAGLARFSKIGDYVSKRAHILFNNGQSKEGGSESSNQKYLQMAFSSLDMNSLVQCCLANE